MAHASSSDADVGRPLKRREDRRLLLGAGRFVDDMRPAGALHVAFVRSPLRARAADVGWTWRRRAGARRRRGGHRRGGAAPRADAGEPPGAGHEGAAASDHRRRARPRRGHAGGGGGRGERARGARRRGPDRRRLRAAAERGGAGGGARRGRARAVRRGRGQPLVHAARCEADDRRRAFARAAHRASLRVDQARIWRADRAADRAGAAWTRRRQET